MGVLKKNSNIVLLGIVIVAASGADSFSVIVPAVIRNGGNAVPLYLMDVCLSMAKCTLAASFAVNAQTTDKATKEDDWQKRSGPHDEIGLAK